MNMFDIEAGRPTVARYVISGLLDDHLDHIISVHGAVYWVGLLEVLTMVDNTDNWCTCYRR